eukprot:jgi/Tetstr1/457238/TSEL_004168.t1
MAGVRVKRQLELIRELRSRLQAQRNYASHVRQLAGVTGYVLVFILLVLAQNHLMYRGGNGFQVPSLRLRRYVQGSAYLRNSRPTTTPR